ncbi:MAG: hypothetical protein V1866_00775 [archaeon]
MAKIDCVKRCRIGWITPKIIVILILVILLLMSVETIAIPQGVSIIYGTTENASVRPADSHAAEGGSFTTLRLNVTSQTSKWKAYVGNVTGRITLDDSSNRSIYDWSLTSIQGEVYVSRNNSINFSSLGCANGSQIISEENYLNISSLSDDSINSTFRQKIHKSFVIGGVGSIQNSSCYAISTYINDAPQTFNETSQFQEVLLSDTRNLVFVTLLENKKVGFDTRVYDFQFIVPDDPREISTTYFFYAELG